MESGFTPYFFLFVPQGKVWLIDFNPFGEVTDSLLFTWEELISGKNLKGDFSEGDSQEQVRDPKETVKECQLCACASHTVSPDPQLWESP